MRAAIFNGPGKPITVERVDDPSPGRDEVVVKVCRCGICGSDVSMTGAGPFTYPFPYRFGHEYAGEIVAVGRDVALKVGDRIACLPAVGCGRCEGCRNGNALFCANIHGQSQGFSEYVAVASRGAIRLPRSLSFADGALVEPMACGLHALRMAAMRGGERVLVLGAGAMALSVIFWARKLGASKVVVLSRSAHRSDVAMAMGADAVLSFADDAQRVTEALGGAPHIVAECVGKEGMIGTAIGHVTAQGTVIAMGMCMHNEPILPAACTFKEVRLLFPLGYSSDEFIETVKAFDAGRVQPEIMVSEVIALEQIDDAMNKLRAGAKSLKVHVDPTLSPTDG